MYCFAFSLGKTFLNLFMLIEKYKILFIEKVFQEINLETLIVIGSPLGLPDLTSLHRDKLLANIGTKKVSTLL